MVKINQEKVRWEGLEMRLAEIYLKRAEKVAFVRGDSDVDFQYVADVIDVAHHAGVERVGLLTMESGSGGRVAATYRQLSRTLSRAVELEIDCRPDLLVGGFLWKSPAAHGFFDCAAEHGRTA